MVCLVPAACTTLSGASDLVVADTLDSPIDASPPPEDAPFDESGDPPDAAVADADVDADAGNGFFDDFDRPDSAVIGNGWIEKNTAAFSIVQGRVVKAATGVLSYRDNIVYRPPSEDVRDVEASIEIFTANPPEYPQIFVRAQRNTIEIADTYDGYIVYVENDPTVAILGRQRGSVFVVTLAELTIDPPLVPGARQRIRLAARGTSPVKVDAWIERFEGGTWLVSAEAHVDDTSSDRVQGAGAVGFSANEDPQPIYDNFAWRELPPP